MRRSLVILPGSFSGPWAFGFANPMKVYGPNGELRLAVFVTDENISIPTEGRELIVENSDTLNGVLAQVGFTRTKPAPPPTPGAEPEPVVVTVVPPEVLPVIPPPEPIIVMALPAEPEVILALPKPSLLSRIGQFFRR